MSEKELRRIVRSIVNEARPIPGIRGGRPRPKADTIWQGRSYNKGGKRISDLRANLVDGGIDDDDVDDQVSMADPDYEFIWEFVGMTEDEWYELPPHERGEEEEQLEYQGYIFDGSGHFIGRRE